MAMRACSLRQLIVGGVVVFLAANFILVAVMLSRAQPKVLLKQRSLEDALANAEVKVNWQLPGVGNTSAVDARWQNVTGTRTNLFVYSAFWEQPSTVRVICAGATKRRQIESIWCRVWFDQLRSATVRAQIKVIREHQNLKYSACFLLCPLGGGIVEIPHSVSIVHDLLDAPTNHVLIARPAPDSQPISLGVCVKPFYNYNKTLELVEFLEMYALLGVGRFTLYMHTADPAVECILRHYQALGSVQVLDWQVALASQKEVRTENMFAALNDCVYRARALADNLALVDFDEFIVPRGNQSLLDLVRQLDTESESSSLGPVGSYVFQNAFFYRQFPSDLSSARAQGEALEPFARRMLTVTKTRRKTAMLPHRQRSKYVCKPAHTVEAGNHFVWQHADHYRAVLVSASRATSQHYRVCEFGGDDCVKDPNHEDLTARRYQPQLVPRVAQVWNDLKQECQLPDVSADSNDYRL